VQDNAAASAAVDLPAEEFEKVEGLSLPADIYGPLGQSKRVKRSLRDGG
jgi:hypothetical protein